MNAASTFYKRPWKDLFTLLFILICCVLITSIVFGALRLLIFEHQDINSNFSSEDSGARYFTYLMLAASSMSTFLLPALFFQKYDKSQQIFPQEHITDWKNYFLSILFLLAIAPCMSLVSTWNMQMSLPEFFAGVEEWMRYKENQAAALTASMVMQTDFESLLINIIVLGILPAIGEEFFFRGALQHIIFRFFKDKHISIWIVALIFSAIHFQFFGFFPRMLLGVFFGYVLLWTSNIWAAVFSHFVNNTMVVIMAFMYARQGKDYADLMEADSYSNIAYLGSFVGSMLIAYVFYLYTIRKKQHGKRVD